MTELVPFVEMFEALRMGPTFARGRRDERSGHVRSLTISGSLVVAMVRGPDDPRAFRSRIAVRAFGAAEWARVEDDLAGQARYVADLLAGRMPDGIEAVFEAAGLSLLPLSIGDIAMDCTCERWPMPCAHLAATIYAAARSFQSDPFGVFAWRGRPRDELLQRLSQLRGAAAVEALTSGAASPASAGADEARSGSGADFADAGLGDPDDFWGEVRAPADPTRGPSPVGGRSDALLDQMDPPSLTVGALPLTEVLRPAYLALPPDD